MVVQNPDDVFTLSCSNGEVSGDICDLLAAVEAGQLVNLPAVRHYARHGVVSNLAAFIAVMHHYGERPSPWTADDWREEWDRQLGERTRELRRPLDEPALFQRPVSPGVKIEPIEPAEIGASPLGDRHIRKASPITDEEFILGHLASTLRPTNGRSQQATGSRAGALMVIPTDGTICSEIMTIANALTCEHGSSARDHMAWLLPSRQPRVRTTVAPIVDTTMASRLTSAGVVHGSSARALDLEGRLDSQIAVRIDGRQVGPVKTSPASPWRWKLVLGALADGVEVSSSGVSRAAPILETNHPRPGIRLVSLGTDNGKTTGFRELVLPARPAATRVFALAGQGGTDRPSQLAQRLVAAVSEARSQLSGALLRMCRNRYDEGEREVAFVRAGLFEEDAGFDAVRLFAERLGEDDDDRPYIDGVLSAKMEEHFDRAASACPDPLRVARGALWLRRMENKMNEGDGVPRLGMQIWAILRQMRSELSLNDRAAIRGSGLDETPPMAVWRCMSHVPQDQLVNPDAERTWRTAIAYLGAADIGERRAGRALFSSQYPEPRMQALLANRGSGHVPEALAWLRSTDTANVDITPLLTLSLADIQRDTEARRWAERTLALDYVRPSARASSVSAEAPEPLETE